MIWGEGQIITVTEYFTLTITKKQNYFLTLYM